MIEGNVVLVGVPHLGEQGDLFLNFRNIIFGSVEIDDFEGYDKSGGGMDTLVHSTVRSLAYEFLPEA